jgi:CheY-like chemotaxis protein
VVTQTAVGRDGKSLALRGVGNEGPRTQGKRTELNIVTQNIFAAVDDMFFAAKIRATAEALGGSIKFYRRLDALVTAAGEQSPNLIVVDLHNEKLDPLELARELKANESLKAIPLLGFFSHVQTDLQRAALEAGYDQVIPRSVFSRDLGQILKG